MVITTLGLYIILAISIIIRANIRGIIMAGKRINRKLTWEETGVSEIIGTILMLSITVVLFSSIITFVGRMPAPQESFNVEVDCYIEPINSANWSEGVNFTMIHQGGKVLDPMWIKIFITIDQTTLEKDLNTGLEDKNGDKNKTVAKKPVRFSH